MHQAATEAGEDPDRVSFTRTLRVVRCQVSDQAAFSPADSSPPFGARWLSCASDCFRFGVGDTTLASSNGRCPVGRSNAPITVIQTRRPNRPSSIVAATKTTSQKRTSGLKSPALGLANE